MLLGMQLVIGVLEFHHVIMWIDVISARCSKHSLLSLYGLLSKRASFDHECVF